MSYRFPGMDPYLENSTIWRDFHHSLAEEIRGRLNKEIGPKYYAGVEVYSVMEEITIGAPKAVIPDVGLLTQPEEETVATMPVAAPSIAAPIQRQAVAIPTKLRSVRVYATSTDELITAIEILSPYNKTGEGLAEYRSKRAHLMGSAVNLVELDLLRGGQRAGKEVEDPPLENADYVLLVNRSGNANPLNVSDIWPVALNEPLPDLPIPLRLPDADVVLNLNEAIRAVYIRAGYAWRVDYNQPVPPQKLRSVIEEWVSELA